MLSHGAKIRCFLVTISLQNVDVYHVYNAVDYRLYHNPLYVSGAGPMTNSLSLELLVKHGSIYLAVMFTTQRL